MSGHTPGPWRWLGSLGLAGGTKPRGSTVLTWKRDTSGAIYLATSTPDRGLAPLDPESPDAKLIAAAPDMAEALLNLVEGLKFNGEWKPGMTTASEAALRKAGVIP